MTVDKGSEDLTHTDFSTFVCLEHQQCVLLYVWDDLQKREYG